MSGGLKGCLSQLREGVRYYYHFDGLGSVMQVTNGKKVVASYKYDAWGNDLTDPQSLIPNPFKYVGKHGYYLDTESALMLLGVRCYGANISGFLSLDPLREDGWNWYLYVHNNPKNSIDPSGLFKLIGCTQEKHPITLEALRLACKAGERCSSLDNSQRECIKKLCEDDRTPLRCGSPYCATGQVCGYACPLGTKYEGIVICVSIVATESCKPKGCNPSKVEQVAKTILHEILHMCGVPDHPDYLRESRQCSNVNGQEICTPDRSKRFEGNNPADRLAIRCLGLEDKGCQPLPAYKYSDSSGWNPCQDWRPPRRKCLLFFPVGFPPWEWGDIYD